MRGARRRGRLRSPRTHNFDFQHPMCSQDAPLGAIHGSTEETAQQLGRVPSFAAKPLGPATPKPGSEPSRRLRWGRHGPRGPVVECATEMPRHSPSVGSQNDQQLPPLEAARYGSTSLLSRV